jgi:hypothetical protein
VFISLELPRQRPTDKDKIVVVFQVYQHLWVWSRPETGCRTTGRRISSIKPTSQIKNKFWMK